MAEVRRIAALALAERAKAGIRVRQPLAALRMRNDELGVMKMADILKDEVNVKEVVVDPKLKNEVELDTAITPELRNEGMLREIIRNIQEMRRDAGFRPHDRIRIQVDGDPGLVALIAQSGALRRAVGADEVSVGGKRQFTTERNIALDGVPLWIGIRRV